MAKKNLVKKRKLTIKQKKFCELYSSSDEFFGNGVQSYIEAYKPKKTKNWYNSAKASACDNLTNPYILSHINKILELRGLNDAFVDKQLEFLITQNGDLKSKLGGIKEYNVLKSRVKQGEGSKSLSATLIKIVIEKADGRVHGIKNKPDIQTRESVDSVK